MYIYYWRCLEGFRHISHEVIK